MRSFDIPERYRSSIISTLKRTRERVDRQRRDLEPAVFDLGRLRFKIARHFGFCFGVQNAIETAYRALEEQPHRRVFLLSEMIHNRWVNEDLQARGVRFLFSPEGAELLPLNELRADDVVIVPAFGTSVELFARLKEIGIDPERYNTTCPFVERVWKKAAQLGQQGVTVVIHGKRNHEETRATFSHARLSGPSLVIRDMREAELLAEFIRGKRARSEFSEVFAGGFSEGFDPARDLSRIGVVNQTTMLAGQTQEIAGVLRAALAAAYGEAAIGEHFADTRDTLCYATTENQSSLRTLAAAGGDLAVVVGGYNSSNTSHLVEMIAEMLPTYYIEGEGEILSAEQIRHFDFARKEVVFTDGWLPRDRGKIDVLLTAGASCPDAVVDLVIRRIAACAGVEDKIESAVQEYLNAQDVTAPN